MESFKLTLKNHVSIIDSSLDAHLTKKSPDCILYSQDGTLFKIHKEVLCQTSLLRKILSSAKEHCCGIIEILCPCSKEELGSMVTFLYYGEIYTEKECDFIKIQENLCKIFGFPNNFHKNFGLKFWTGADCGIVFTKDDTEKDVTIPKNLDMNMSKEELLDNELHLSDSDSEAVTNEVSENIPEIPCGDKTTPDIQYDNSQVDGINDFSREIKQDLKRRKTQFLKKITRKFQCKVCRSIFFDRSSLNQHKKRVHLKSKSNTCKYCGTSFFNHQVLQKHWKIIHRQGKTKIDSENQNSKKINNEKVSRITCNYCGTTYANESILEGHIEKRHLKIGREKSIKRKEWPSPVDRPIKSKSQSHKCEFCSKNYATNSLLKKHVDYFHLKQYFMCKQCRMTFFEKHELRSHVTKKHPKEKVSRKTICTECEACFVKRSDLEYHMNSVHLKVKGHKCKLCNKSFVTKSMLKEHIHLKHSKIKVEKKRNEKKSKISSDNNNRLQSPSKNGHLKLNLHKCNTCPKYFAKKSEMIKHHRLSHKWPAVLNTKFSKK